MLEFQLYIFEHYWWILLIVSIIFIIAGAFVVSDAYENCNKNE